MTDHELLKCYPDQNRVKNVRFDYAHILQRLTFFAQSQPGHWVLVALHPDRNPSARLQAKASEQWIPVEVYTRRERPRADGQEGWYEIWARIAK